MGGNKGWKVRGVWMPGDQCLLCLVKDTLAVCLVKGMLTMCLVKGAQEKGKSRMGMLVM